MVISDHFEESGLFLIELNFKFLVKVRLQLPKWPLVDVYRSSECARLTFLQEIDTIFSIKH